MVWWVWKNCFSHEWFVFLSTSSQLACNRDSCRDSIFWVPILSMGKGNNLRNNCRLFPTECAYVHSASSRPMERILRCAVLLNSCKFMRIYLCFRTVQTCRNKMADTVLIMPAVNDDEKCHLLLQWFSNLILVSQRTLIPRRTILANPRVKGTLFSEWPWFAKSWDRKKLAIY